MQRLFLSLILILFAGYANAANVCVGPTATGTGNGADWNNVMQWSSITSTGFVRGNTYYLMDGAYGGKTFSTPVSSTTQIYIKKATASDHGSSTGWSSSYGDGQAIFTGYIYFTTSYWTFDGQVGAWSSDWPEYVQHGFLLRPTAGGDNRYLLRAGASGATVGGITIAHVEGYWGNTTTWWKSQFHWYGYVNSTGVTISRCWFHLGGGSVMTHLSGPLTLEYSVIEENGNAQAVMDWSPSEHSVLLQIRDQADNNIIRYNVFRRWESSGCLIFYSNVDDSVIHGNLFVLDAEGGTSYAKPYRGESNGVINGYGAGVSYERNKIYNNTFVDINYSTALPYVCTIGAWAADNEFKNNLIYDCNGYTTFNVGGALIKSHNWYYNSGTHTESNVQNGTGDPFVSRASKNYKLSGGTNSGYNVGASFNTDAYGETRGSDGVWDRGAYEYDTGGVDPDDYPGITITSPTSDSSYSTTSSSVNLGGTSSDDNGVASVTWACATCTPTSGNATGTTSWTISSIGLTAGNNTIVVTVTDTADQTATDTIYVYYDSTGTDVTAPVISVLLPTGAITYAETKTLECDTDETATCKGATSKALFDDMDIIFTAAVNHHTATSPTLSPNTSYSYWVRCRDTAGNTSAASNIAFTTGPSLPDSGLIGVTGGGSLAVGLTSGSLTISW